jgi:hypothetical protein
MAPKPNLPTLLRTYTSLLSHRTSQLQFHASRFLGVSQSRSQNAWTPHMDSIALCISRLTRTTPRLQPIPIRIRSNLQRRFISTDAQGPKPYAYEDVCFFPLSLSPRPD